MARKVTATTPPAPTTQPPSTKDVKSAARASTAPGPTMLMNCEGLAARPSCDSVRFTQFVELVQQGKGCRVVRIPHPVQVSAKLCLLKSKLIKHTAVLQAGRLIASGKYDPSKDIRFAELVGTLQKKNSTHIAQLSKAGSSTQQSVRSLRDMKVTVPRATPSDAHQTTRYLATPDSPLNWTNFIREFASDVAVAPVSPEQGYLLEPTIAVGVTFRQDWCSQGYTRGRLIRSIPVAADGKKEIVVKAWATRKQRREENSSVEQNISTEFIGDEKWSLAVTKQVSATMNQSLDANLKANADVSVPVKAVKVGAGAGGGVGSNTAGSLSASMSETEEKIRQVTTKAANSLKNTVSSVIETAEEAGLETTTTETIVNPNKCASLTYHFFEIQEDFKVSTAVESVEPFLLVPLAIPDITYEWVLCNECVLHRHLPCETFYEGLKAAKRLLVNEHLGEFLGSIDSPEIDTQADSVLKQIAAVLEPYLALKNATLEVRPRNASVVDDFFNWLGDTAKAGQEAGQNIIDGAHKAWDEGTKLVEDTFNAVTSMFDARSMAPRMYAAAAVSQPGIQFEAGGPGSYIYWEVLKIAAPNVESALAALHQVYSQQLSSMPAGPARTRAIHGALVAFFQTLGDVDLAFLKIQIGLYLLFAVALAGLVAAVYVSATIGAGLVIAFGATGPALIVILLPYIGAGMTLLAGLGAVIIAAASDGTFDLMPDDRGLKGAVQGLYGMSQQLGQSIALPVPPQGDDPEALARYERELAEAKKETREIAEAQVEFNRLQCHIRHHIAYYLQATATTISENDLRLLLEEVYGLPPGVVQVQIAGFVGTRAAFRVLDADWFKLSGYDHAAVMSNPAVTTFFSAQRTPTDITMPTPGLVVEPRLGHCTACDDVVMAHRQLDLELKREDVAKAHVENLRRQLRIDAGDLDDPEDRQAHIGVTLDSAAPAGTGT